MKLRVPRSLQPSKTLIVLGVAIAIGLVAALAARSYLTHRVEAIEAQAHGRTVELVVAKQDLDKGAVLSNDNVAVRAIPAEYAHQTAIAPAGFNRAEGEKLAYAVKAGQLIYWGLLENKRTPTFSARVEVGHRAITVPVDEINSISGMLEPGDVIDLIATLDRPGGKATFPLLQRVQVLATGQRSVDDPQSGERRDYSTVTLDTTPAQAQRVIMAREGGRITALLRNAKDAQSMSDAGVSLEALSEGRSAPGHPVLREAGLGGVRGSGEGVPVLYGGRSAPFTPDELAMAAPSAASRP